MTGLPHFTLTRSPQVLGFIPCGLGTDPDIEDEDENGDDGQFPCSTSNYARWRFQCVIFLRKLAPVSQYQRE